MAAPINTPPNPPQYNEAWMPPEKELWSIPPVITDEMAAGPAADNSIRLRQGIVCQIDLDSDWLFQNINLNENEVIEFSLHGVPDGIWGRMHAGTLIRANGTIFFLNRTRNDVLHLATFKQNDD